MRIGSRSGNQTSLRYSEVPNKRDTYISYANTARSEFTKIVIVFISWNKKKVLQSVSPVGSSGTKLLIISP